MALLDKDIRDYNKYFDYNYVVIGKSHLKHVDEHVPAHWGIISCSGDTPDDIVFDMIREPEHNPKLKIEYKMSFLWRRELENIRAEKLKYKYANLSKAKLCRKIIDAVDRKELDLLISRELFNRDYTTI